MAEWIECVHGVKIEYCRSCAADYFQERAEAAEATAAELRAQLATAHAKLATVTSERDAALEQLKHANAAFDNVYSEGMQP